MLLKGKPGAMEVIAMDKGCYVGHNILARHYDHIIASETLYPMGYSSDWHYHQNPHFSHILYGGSQEINENNTKIQQPGEGFYYYPGIAHQNIQYRVQTRIFNVELGSGFFEKYQLNIPPETLMFSENLQLNASGLVKILREHWLQDDQSTLSINQLTVELITHAADNISFFPGWAKKIRPLLYDTWNQPVSLQEISKLLDIHPVTLSKYFSKYFGCTLGEYRRRIKIERALPLIRQGKYTLTEIAYLCEFCDQAHFTKTFHRITGFSPKQYKAL
ncbi:AraC family transcriptional regulator [Arachidicoccus rhizosphaerae]|uniref:AraC family transcriptional regulator n=1 Tax=Arachidicoccus rhizosphaerae TaxID=551991 RepID=A0A1H3WP40_9BACT|nr:helix-turn-helix domain-containing protein [Arachidicoccus rhizosphaerae]SDZ87958.1 AraC family transcriptional regulator [Arachidicoccus rhizosphaerae]